MSDSAATCTPAPVITPGAEAGQQQQPGSAEYEAFTFMIEAEQAFGMAKDAVVATFATGMKKRISVVTPESLLAMMLADQELLAEISSVVKDIAATAAAGISSIAGATPTQQLEQPAGPGAQEQAAAQPEQQASTGGAQQQAAQQESVATKRVALAKAIDGEVWARLLEAKLVQDKAAALKARAMQPVAEEDTKPEPLGGKAGAQAGATAAAGAGGAARKKKAPAGQNIKSPDEPQACMTVPAAAQGDDARRTPVGKSRAPGIGGKKKRRGSDFLDDAPAGCPDAFYLLEGFPATAEHVELMQDRGIPLGAVVSLSVAPVLRMRQGTEAATNRSQRTVSSKQAPRPRKRRGEDKSAEEQDGKAADQAPVFSVLHSELKSLPSLGALWLAVGDGDPGDPSDTVHKVASKLYELFQLRLQYNAWVKTCSITRFGKAPDGERSHAEKLLATLPDNVVSHALMLNFISEAAGGSGQRDPDKPAGAEEEGKESEVEAHLSRFIDQTLSWLLGDDGPATAAQSAAEETPAMPPPVQILRFGDDRGVKVCGLPEGVAAMVKASEAGLTNALSVPGHRRCCMPEQPEKSELERAGDQAEVTAFLSGVVKPPLSSSEIDRILTLLECEDMIAAARGGSKEQVKLDDRVFLEHFDPDVFPQVFAEALASSPKVCTHYFADQDAVLVCLDSGATIGCADDQETTTWKAGVTCRPTFKQWLEATGAPTAPPGSTSGTRRPMSELPTDRTDVLERLRPPPGTAIYDVDESKVRMEKSTRTLCLADGCTAAVTRSSAPGHVGVSVTLSMPSPSPASISLHVNKRKRQQQVTTLTGSFPDLSSFCASEQHGRPRLSYAQQNGHVTVLCTGPTVEQVIVTATARRAASEQGGDFRQSPLAELDSGARDRSPDTEVSRRTFVAQSGLTGVCRFLADGSTEVLYSDGSTERYSPATGVWQGRNAKGDRIVRDRRGAEQRSTTGAATVTDPETGQVVVTREDMSMFVRSPTGETQARFPDGTAIRCFVDGATVVETPGLSVVRRTGDSLRIVLPDGSEASCTASRIELSKAGCVAVRLGSDGNADVQSIAIQGPDTAAIVRPGIYRFGIRSGVLVTPEYESHRFSIGSDGTVSEQQSGGSSGSDRLPAWVSHPPRLFRVAEDGSATEYLSPAQVVPYLALSKRRHPRVTIAEQAVTGEQVTSIAVVHQISPSTDRTTARTDAALPKIIALDDPDFVESSVATPPQQPVIAVVRQLLRHRRLTDEEFSAVLDSLDAFEDHRRRQTPVSLDTTGHSDPRTPEEREAQAKLQAQLVAMLDEEAKAALVSKAGVGSPDPTSRLASKPESAHPAPAVTTAQQVPATLLQPQQAVAQDKRQPSGSRRSSSQRSGLNYFNSEEALAFLKATTAPRPPAVTVSGDPLLLVKKQQQQAATQRRRAETPPAAGLAMADFGLEESPEAAPATTTVTKFGQQATTRRPINISSLAGGKAVPPPAQAFTVFPATLGFGQIEGGFSHQLSLSLTNMTFDSARFLVKQPSEASLLRITYIRGPVAPGMTAQVAVALRATTVGRYADEITIVAADDSVVRVPVTAEVLPSDVFARLPREQQRRWRSKKIRLQQAVPPPLSSSQTQSTQLPPLRK